MIELLENLQFWQWWAFAGALVVVETLLPSGILYGVAVAAFLVGGAMAAEVEQAATWQSQLGGFAALSILFGWIGRALRNRLLAPKAADAEIDSRPSIRMKPPAAPPANKPEPAAPKPASAAKAPPKPAPKPAPAAKAPAKPAPAKAKPPLDLKKPAPANVAEQRTKKPVAEQPTKKPVAEQRTKEPKSDLIGGVFTIWTPIAGGTGSIKIKGADYALVGPDMPGGSRIKVVDVKEKILKVEALD